MIASPVTEAVTDVVAQLPGAGPFAVVLIAVSVLSTVVAIAGRRASADLDRLRAILDEQSEDKDRLRAELSAGRDREDRLVAELDRARWELSSARAAEARLEEEIRMVRAEKAALVETAAVTAAKLVRVEQAMQALEGQVGIPHRRAVDGPE